METTLLTVRTGGVEAVLELTGEDLRLALGTWQSVALVDLNLDNPIRQVPLSFLSG